MATPHDGNPGHSLRAFDISMIVIPTVAVGLRFWSRIIHKTQNRSRLGWDDWIILMALPFSIISNALHIYAVSLGLGKHVLSLPKENLTQILKVLWVTYFMGDAGISLPKASVLLFYARIFSTRNRAFRYGLWVGHALNFLWWVGAIVRCVLFCSPVEKYWNTEEPGFCRSADALYIGSAVPSVFIDFYILLLPLPIIWTLSMKLGHKLLVVGVFACGYLVITISLGRLITSLISGEKLNKDLTYNGVPLIFWVAAEPPVSILGCCLPIIFYLVQRGIRSGPLSLFSTTIKSKPDYSKPPPKRLLGHHHISSERSLEPETGSLTTSGDFGHVATATKASPAAEYIHMDDHPKPSAIGVRKDVDVRSQPV